MPIDGTKEKKWKKVWVRNAQIISIEQLVDERPDLGYNGVSGFIAAAIRSKLQDYYDNLQSTDM